MNAPKCSKCLTIVHVECLVNRSCLLCNEKRKRLFSDAMTPLKETKKSKVPKMVELDADEPPETIEALEQSTKVTSVFHFARAYGRQPNDNVVQKDDTDELPEASESCAH